MVWPALISAGATLLGGMLGRSDAADARAQEAARQDAMWEKNAALQREFAQQGIKWKVDDARAAGIHPAFALGAQTHSASPISVGSLPDVPSMGPTLASMGQDVSRAMHATRSTPEREAAMKMSAIQLEGAQLDNDIKRASLASSIQRLKANANPPLPIPEGSSDARPPLFVDGGKWETSPTSSNVEDWAKRYGEPGEWATAPLVLWNDMVHNSQKVSRPWWGGDTLHNLTRRGMNAAKRRGFRWSN